MIEGYENKEFGGRLVKANRSLYVTEDGRIVEEGHKDAYSLICRPWHKVREGLLDAVEGKKKSKKKSSKKASSKKASEKKDG